MDEAVNVDLFGNPRPADTGQAEVTEAPPRGLLGDGVVRTTGWLQLGAHPVRSEAVGALVLLVHALVIAVAMMPASPVLAGLAVMMLPPCGWVLWALVTTRLLPASRARNVDVVEVAELTVSSWVRLYGSIGPVGQVSSVTSDGEDQVEVCFAGGIRRIWPADHRVHVVELLD